MSTTDTQLSFDYRLTGAGWSECRITRGPHGVTITASYLSDALGQLAAAVLLMQLGSQAARVSFDEEPGEYRWGFDRVVAPDRQPQGIQLRIWRFDDLWAGLPDDKGELQFEQIVELDDLLAATVEMLGNVLNTYGLDGYHERWIEHEFPKALLDQLRRIRSKDAGSSTA